jgi:hypothetical protein
VQGHLRQEKLTFAIETTCAQSGRPIHIAIDTDLNYSVAEKEAELLVFVPSVDFTKLKDPSIIDSF